MIHLQSDIHEQRDVYLEFAYTDDRLFITLIDETGATVGVWSTEDTEQTVAELLDVVR